jgi:uncharacterized membrane protein
MKTPSNNTTFLVAAAVAAAIAAPALAQQSMGDSSAAAAPAKKEKCYGVNAAGKNDCATKAHGCAGETKQARDPGSWISVPAGTCQKIEGGSTTASKA